jgi:hypothetical protein
MIAATAWVALLALHAQLAGAAPGALPSPESEWNEVKGIYRHIEERFPPEAYHYIFPGRSPTGLYALSLIKAHAGHSVPISETRGLTIWDLSFSEKQNLFEHFDRFIDLKAARRGRILIVDFAAGGESLKFFSVALSLWLEERGQNFPIETLALIDRPQGRRILASRPRWTKRGRISPVAWVEFQGNFKSWALPIGDEFPTVFHQLYQGDFYHHVSPYGAFSIYLNIKESPPRLLRRAFTTYLTERSRLEGVEPMSCGAHFD